jgi:glycosyltransferase involved in cell wall biosynthesis
MSNIPLLSICIPTYNRASHLDKVIDSITTQVSFSDSMEIVICDNCSTDNTFEIVTYYQNKYNNIKYYKNDINIGMEKNIIKALHHGTGKLLKLWNDYCLLYEDKLAEIITLIKSNNDEKSILYFHNKSGESADLICTDLNCFFRKTTYWSTWISTFSIWKKDFNAFENTKIFEGLLFPHLLMLLQAFENKKQIQIIFESFFYEEKFIKKGGYDFFEIFIQNFIGKIIHKAYVDKKIDFLTLYIVKAAFFKKFLKTWIKNIVFKKYHNFNNQNISLVFKYFRFYPQLYFLLLEFPFYALINRVKILKRKYLTS